MGRCEYLRTVAFGIPVAASSSDHGVQSGQGESQIIISALPMLKELSSSLSVSSLPSLSSSSPSPSLSFLPGLSLSPLQHHRRQEFKSKPHGDHQCLSACSGDTVLNQRADILRTERRHGSRRSTWTAARRTSGSLDKRKRNGILAGKTGNAAIGTSATVTSVSMHAKGMHDKIADQVMHRRSQLSQSLN